MTKMAAMKTCTKCGDQNAEFGKDASKRDGLTCWCNVCRSTHRAENRDKYMATRAKYCVANREKIRVASAKWRAENPEKYRANKGKYYAANTAAVKAKSANWVAANPEKKKANDAKWRLSNPEKVKSSSAKWKANNPESIRIQNHNRQTRKNGGKLSTGLAKRLFKLQRGLCPCCREPLGDDYHLDHVIPLKLGGSNTDENMQLLRAPCNQEKHARHPVEFMQSRGFLL